MIRLRPLALLAAVVLIAGCTRATFGFRPTLTSQVPDSTVVRLRGNGQPTVTGRSLGWQTGQPRIVSATNDTVAVPEIGTLEVRMAKKKSFAVVGGVVGVVVGMGIAVSKCPVGRECGPTVTPAITGGIGVLIGSLFSRVDWVAVRRSPR
jgi:hypothetical protein